MKTYSVLARVGNRLTQRLKQFSTERRGTVIIIVLALLGMLALIGFFAVTFTGQENQSATYFANSPTAKSLTPSLNPNLFFNDILRQVIIGPGVSEKQSVLWGGNKALLPTMFGRDMAPFSGPGVNLIWNNATNYPALDQNYDGFADNIATGVPNLMQLNFSPGAQGVLVPQASLPVDFNNFGTANNFYPDPDTNITYPDINNVFLASDTLVPNGTGNPVRVITPSFHRPMLLRNAAANLGGTVTPYAWYTDKNTASLVLFPHREHLALDNKGNFPTNTGVANTQRFVSVQYPDLSAIGTQLQPFPIPGDAAAWAATTAYGQGARVQPGTPNQHIYVCTTAGTSGGSQPTFPTTPGATVTDGTAVWTEWSQEGVWTWPVGGSQVGSTPINYDVDTDNDGVVDSRYMDFGFPIMQDSVGNQFVALGAVKIIDADSLFNLNVHGNRAALAQIPVNTNFAGGNNPAFLSLSDHGVSASEVNPQWALNARVFFNSGTGLYQSPDFSGTGAAQSSAVTSALQQYTLFFRPGGSGNNPLNNFDVTEAALSYELSNMEMWNLLNGRPQLAAGTPPTVSGSSFVGRWGENTTRLDPNVAAILANPTHALSAGVSAPGDPFPLPGTSGVDDNNNQLEGGTFSDVQGIFHPAFIQPVDFFTAGNWVTGTQGKLRQLLPGATTTAPMGNEQFPAYSQFYIAPTVGWANVLSAALVPGGSGKQLIDDPDETWTEPSLAAQQTTDSIFGASENAIQLSGADYNTLGNPGRTASLMPFNFVSNLRASLIRQRFTSTSWDLKSFGKQFLGTYDGNTNDARRLWEFTDTSGPPATGAGPFRFPPNFVGTSGSLAPQTSGFTVSDDANSTVPAVYPLRTAVANLIQILANPNQANLSTLTNVLLPQRMLSVNGLTEMYPNGTDSNGNAIYQFRFRPLTPHPSTAVNTFAATAITPFPPASAHSNTLPNVTWIAEPEQLQAGNLPQQEWLARYDRQRMARDIYTLLYLTGGGREANAWRPSAPYVVGALAVPSPPNGHMYICTNAGTTNTTQPTWPTSSGSTVTDGSVTWTADVAAGPPTFAAGTFANYATASNQPNATTGIRPVYTDDQLQEMAQFAVNLVDALDPDSNITLFEYDKDLSDGWNLDDNPYDATNDPITSTHAVDRGLVYGVERQQLCLNESLVTLYQPCINSVTNLAQGHPDIQWDNNQGPNAGLSRQWQMFYTELENLGPTPVSFNNAQWQIAVKQSPIMTANSAYYGTGTGSAGEMRLTLVGPPASGQTAIGTQGSSTLPTLAAGASTGGTSPRLLIGSMVGSNGTPQANHAIAGLPMTFPNPNPSNPTQPAPSYMVADPNDATGTPGPSSSASLNYLYPIAPRAAYGTGPTGSVASPWFGNASVLSPTLSGLDLIDPNQANNYWTVQPNAASANADQAVAAPTGITAGSQLLQFNDPVGTNVLPGLNPVVLRIELRRRADLNRLPFLPSDLNQVAEAQDNPWVTVDYMDVPASVMALKLTAAGAPNDFAAQIQAQLGAYFQTNWRATAQGTAYTTSPGYYQYSLAASSAPNISTERSQPLYHDFGLNPCNPVGQPLFPNGPFLATSATMYQRNGGANTLSPTSWTGTSLWQGNSLGQDNDAAGYNPGTIPGATATAIAPHPLYQPHYDRDFTSIGELFNIPLYGQMQAMTWLPNTTYPVGATIVPPSGTGPGVGGMTFVCTVSGTSGTTPPAWPSTWGAPLSEGTSTPPLQWTPVANLTPTPTGTPSPTQTQMFTGLTHVMASRYPESGTTVLNATPAAPTPELLVGSDTMPNDATILARLHYSGYGTAGFRFQHPEGGDQRNPNPDYASNTAVTSDFTENRWFRLLGLLEVPTRSHRGVEEPNGVSPYQVAAGSIYGSLGFYRTPGKINVNTLRFPDVAAGLVGEPDIFNMNFTGALPTGQNLPANLSVPYLLHDITSDTITIAPPQNTPAWTASTAYSVGNVVVPFVQSPSVQNGFSYICISAGTSGSGQPTWPMTFGATVTDNGVVWTPTPPYAVRDWWEQFITTRDGVDPLPLSNGGTGLSIPGMPRAPMLPTWTASTAYALGATIIPPTLNGYTYVCTTPGTSGTSQPTTWPTLPGVNVNDGSAVWTFGGINPSGSQPFHELGFSAYGGVDSNGYSGPLESTMLRSLSSDAVSPPIGTTSAVAPTFDLRRRLFELGTNAEHLASRDSSGALPAGLDYATKQRLLARLAGNTTTRSNVFFVWIQVDFFQAKDVGPALTPADTGVVRIGSKLSTSPAYRGFFVIDRSAALPLMTSQYLPSATTGQPFVFSFNQSFNWQSLVLFQQRIQ
jgi:hypothetical protein